MLPALQKSHVPCSKCLLGLTFGESMLLNPQLYWEMRTTLQLYIADEERAVHMQKQHNTLQIQRLEHVGRL